MNTFRDMGAVGAILDEYERALIDLKKVIATLDDAAYQKIRDKETKDPDCRSIETICRHVVNSGFGYICYIEKMLGNEIERPKRTAKTVEKALEGLDEMFAFNLQHFSPKAKLPAKDPAWSVNAKVPWGILYDMEQLMEHAIVHILRHRRQIERFLQN